MLTTLSLPEDILTRSVLYRQAEKQALDTQPVSGTIKRLMAKNPTLAQIIQEVWTTTQAQIYAHYTKMIPTTKRGRARGDGPTVYEVHHALTVAKECYLLKLYQQHQQDTPLDAEAAGAFTLERLGVTADLQEFFTRDIFPAQRAL